MAVDEEHSAQADSEERASKEASDEEQSSGVPRRLVVTAALALTIVAIVIVYGYLASPKPDWIGVANKNVWDWLDLLVVPAALAVGVYWLNTRQAARQRQAEDQRQAREDAAQEAQVQHTLEVEDQRAQDAALQAYLDQMSHLLTDKDRPLHRARQGDRLITVARARTLTVLPRLDSERKGRVLDFLYWAGLIDRRQPIIQFGRLQPQFNAADLRGVKLKGAYLTYANLPSVDLRGADLSGASLSMANLSGGAKLGGAILVGTWLTGADLTGADLSDADLSDAQGLSVEQLEKVKSLDRATMPNGRKYEELLEESYEAQRNETMGTGEDEENSDPS